MSCKHCGLSAHSFMQLEGCVAWVFNTIARLAGGGR